jgi:hypothetical protein
MNLSKPASCIFHRVPLHLIADLEGLEYVSSMGLRSFLAVAQKIRSRFSACQVALTLVPSVAGEVVIQPEITAGNAVATLACWRLA